MVEKLNIFFKNTGINLQFNSKKIHHTLAKNLFRERHIAQAIRLAVFEKEPSEEGKKQLLKKLFSGEEVNSPLNDFASLENEIRGNLLKAGGAAFVEEDPKAFLSLDQIISLIINAGGIPCYPVLLDDTKGNFTIFEKDKKNCFRH